jgi:hypothetical protein
VRIVFGRQRLPQPQQPFTRLIPRCILPLALLMAVASACGNEPETAAPAATMPTTVAAASITDPEMTALPIQQPAPFEPLPSIAIVSASTQAAGVQAPAYLEVEIVGEGLGEVTFLAAQVLDDGRRLLVAADRLPNMASTAAGWGGTIHELAQAWFPQAYFLTNGHEGAFVVVRPPAGDEPQLELTGALQSAGSPPADVTLRFDATTGAFKSAAGGPSETLATGDLFQPVTEFLAADGMAITAEPGPELAVTNAETPLAIELRPLPSGRYTAAVHAKLAGQTLASPSVTFIVQNDNLVPGYQAYLSPQWGFQFLVPAHWEVAYSDDGAVVFAGPHEDRELTVAWRPLGGGISEAGLKPLALEQFGPVQPLYEEQRRIAGLPATWTAYGYEAAAGPRTGVLVTFAHEGRGYVVDLDAPAADEAATIQAVDTLVRSWVFRPHGLARAAGAWRSVPWGERAFSLPALYERLGLEGQRLLFRPSGEDGFIALAIAENDSGQQSAAAWQLVESVTGVPAGFNAAEPYPFQIGARDVMLLDLIFDGGRGGPMAGLAIFGDLGDQPVWIVAAAPAAEYSAGHEALFLTVAGDILGAN